MLAAVFILYKESRQVGHASTVNENEEISDDTLVSDDGEQPSRLVQFY